VEPTDHTAGFVWPILPSSISYTLTIWADEYQTVSIVTLTFNAAGQLVNIEFGPAFYNQSAYSPTRAAAKQQTTQEVVSGTTTLNFTITGLASNHTYYYLLNAYDETGIVDTKSGHFTTTGGFTAIEQITDDHASMTMKFMKDGYIYILRGDRIYTIQGQQVQTKANN
jgi:hypothetical protein